MLTIVGCMVSGDATMQYQELEVVTMTDLSFGFAQYIM